MVRIEDSKPGRRDGGYARLFNDADIGALVSRVHATSIRAGTELEHIIICFGRYCSGISRYSTD